MTIEVSIDRSGFENGKMSLTLRAHRIRTEDSPPGVSHFSFGYFKDGSTVMGTVNCFQFEVV